MENKWYLYAIFAALFYGLHQIFTKLASSGIGEGLGGFVVEFTAAMIIGVYAVFQYKYSNNISASSTNGVVYSVLTGICVGIGTILFFLLFKRNAPLSAVPAILAVGLAVMVIAGVLFFKEKLNVSKIAGIVLSIAGLFLLKR